MDFLADRKAIEGMKYIHLSVDDVELISINKKADFFKRGHLGYELVKLHNLYGIKISLYAQNWNEWKSIKDGEYRQLDKYCQWLKLGIHTPSNGGDFGEYNYISGKNEWELFCREVVRIGGNADSIDRLPRLHRFAGSKECIRGMNDADICSALGFICADDMRLSYYINEHVNSNGCDKEFGLYFFPSDIRLDWFDRKCHTSEYDHWIPKTHNVINELKRYFLNIDKSVYVVFVHQWQLCKGTKLKYRKKWLEKLCIIVNELKMSYTFLEEHRSESIMKV